MERITKIWEHPVYREEYRKLTEAEKERVFCRHTLEHFLDTARIGWIINLEQGGAISKALIYATGLIHDIGRWKQISEGVPHEEASVQLAMEILPECDFSTEEIKEICDAVSHHRGDQNSDSAGSLGEVLYRADKLSRCCFACAAKSDCNWSDEKMNHTITV